MTIVKEIATVEVAEDLLRPAAQEAFVAWQQWSADCEPGTLPDWANFSPSKHTRILPHLVLHHVENKDVSKARIVLTGNEVARKLRIDSINVAISDAIAEANIQHLMKCLQFCIDVGQPAHTIKRMDWSDRFETIYDCLFLPFSKGAQSLRILCVMHFDLKIEELGVQANFDDPIVKL